MLSIRTNSINCDTACTRWTWLSFRIIWCESLEPMKKTVMRKTMSQNHRRTQSERNWDILISYVLRMDGLQGGSILLGPYRFVDCAHQC